MPSKHAISVSLTEHLSSFVKTEIAAGRYRTASEVVRAGLRLLEEQRVLRSVQPGGSLEDSGDASSEAPLAGNAPSRDERTSPDAATETP